MSTNEAPLGQQVANALAKTEQLEAENEQLRAALERIKRESGNPGFAPSAIAREALKGGM